MFVATVVEAAVLFQFAEEEGIAYYNSIQDLIWRGDEENNRRHQWYTTAFTVGRDDFDPYWLDDRIDWVPQVEEMVRRYMTVHDIEVLFIVVSTNSYVIEPLNIPRNQ